MRLIGLAGPAGCGKTTVSEIVQSLRPDMQVLNFASALKAMLKVGLGLTEQQVNGDQKEVIDPRYGCTPRHIMRTLGTDWGREQICPDIWLKATAIMAAGKDSIIGDVRFENEAQFVRKDGTLIHISRPGFGPGAHQSEAGVEFKAGDLVLVNDMTLPQLEQEVSALLKLLEGDIL